MLDASHFSSFCCVPLERINHNIIYLLILNLSFGVGVKTPLQIIEVPG